MAELNVLYQFDNNYAPIGGISVTSLLRNNRDIEKLTVYLAVTGVTEDNLEKLHQLADAYGRELVFLNTDGIYEQLAEIGARGWNGSMATWMKMFVIGSLPETVDKLLYIDCDTVVCGSLRELAELDMGEHPVAAVADSIARTSRARLHLVGSYFNAGLIYFNLKLWRERNIAPDMIEHLRLHVAEYPVNDQDLLNDYFRGRILKLSPRYNFQGTHFFYRDKPYFQVMDWEKDAYYTPEDVALARQNIAIVHFFRFCGEYPWQSGTIHSCKAMYEEERNQSLWKDVRYPAKKLDLIFRIERILYRVLPQSLFLRILLQRKNKG